MRVRILTRLSHSPSSRAAFLANFLPAVSMDARRTSRSASSKYLRSTDNGMFLPLKRKVISLISLSYSVTSPASSTASGTILSSIMRNASSYTLATLGFISSSASDTCGLFRNALYSATLAADSRGMFSS